jgi:hypothetical protein
MDCTTFNAPCQIALMTAGGANKHAITGDQTVSNQKPSWQAIPRDNGQAGESGG